MHIYFVYLFVWLSKHESSSFRLCVRVLLFCFAIIAVLLASMLMFCALLILATTKCFVLLLLGGDQQAHFSITTVTKKTTKNRNKTGSQITDITGHDPRTGRTCGLQEMVAYIHCTGEKNSLAHF